MLVLRVHPYRKERIVSHVSTTPGARSFTVMHASAWCLVSHRRARVRALDVRGPNLLEPALYEGPGLMTCRARSPPSLYPAAMCTCVCACVCVCARAFVNRYRERSGNAVQNYEPFKLHPGTAAASLKSVQEQLSLAHRHHTIDFTTIGSRINVLAVCREQDARLGRPLECIDSGHRAAGGAEVTLGRLHAFCSVRRTGTPINAPKPHHHPLCPPNRQHRRPACALRPWLRVYHAC